MLSRPIRLRQERAMATSPDANTLSLEAAQEMALRITTVFEGGTPMNYQALSGDFDGQGTSFGLIQWNFGQGTLGPLLKLMLDADPAAFAACFGSGADFETRKAALVANRVADQLTWARTLQKSNKPAWSAAFKAIGANDVFNSIQRQQAAGHYHPLVLTALASLRSIAGTLLQAVEFRSYAALFDLCVQQNGLTKAADAIRQRVASERPATQLDLLKIAVVERGKVASPDWAADCISRRMGVLTGAPFEATASGLTKKRDNSQLGLIATSGLRPVAGL
jgi:hypothetical protein